VRVGTGLDTGLAVALRCAPMDAHASMPVHTPAARADRRARVWFLCVVLVLATVGWCIRGRVALEFQLVPFIQWIQAVRAVAPTASRRSLPVEPSAPSLNSSKRRTLATIVLGDGAKDRRLAAMHLLRRADEADSLAVWRAASSDVDDDVADFAWDSLQFFKDKSTGHYWLSRCPISELTDLVRAVPPQRLQSWGISVLFWKRREWVAIAEAMFPRLPAPEATRSVTGIQQVLRCYDTASERRQAAKQCFRIGLTNPDPQVREEFCRGLFTLGETDLPESSLADLATHLHRAELERACLLLAKQHSSRLEEIVRSQFTAGCEQSNPLAMDLLTFLEMAAGRPKAREVASEGLGASEEAVRQAARKWLDGQPEIK